MIPIKIECGCGQHYAFDIEPVDGRMPCTIACPTCGIDGTGTANDLIAQTIGIPALAEAAPEPVAQPAARPSSYPKKEIDIIKVTNEARAKTMWGDEPQQVVNFLMLQGLSPEEASQLSTALFAERAKTIRVNGIGKIVTGIGMMCVPVIAYLFFRTMRVIPIKLLGMAGVIGLWGVYRVLKGTIMFLAPKSEPGDVSSQ